MRRETREEPGEEPLDSRPDGPELKPVPVPDELTGRASKTEDDLGALFKNEEDDHLADGFRGGSGDEPLPGSDSEEDGS